MVLVVQGLNKPLFLFVGKSASGKTTIANMLEANGYTQIQSYTTRPERYKGETGHTFISEEEYSQLENNMAYTFYNNYHYCTTLEQVQNADIYVVDVEGVKTLMDNSHLINRDIYVVYFATSVYNRIQRMLEREDSDTHIVGRLLNDEAEDWYEQLTKVISYKKIKDINANLELDRVYEVVKTFIETGWQIN